MKPIGASAGEPQRPAAWPREDPGLGRPDGEEMQPMTSAGFVRHGPIVALSPNAGWRRRSDLRQPRASTTALIRSSVRCIPASRSTLRSSMRMR